jgi:hypothetical protein
MMTMNDRERNAEGFSHGDYNEAIQRTWRVGGICISLGVEGWTRRQERSENNMRSGWEGNKWRRTTSEWAVIAIGELQREDNPSTVFEIVSIFSSIRNSIASCSVTSILCSYFCIFYFLSSCVILAAKIKVQSSAGITFLLAPP